MTQNQQGFTAVELLITLFIGTIFLIAGYQLSVQVTKDGADAEKTARVSNVVYERLRKTRFDSFQTVCGGAGSPSAPSNENVTIDGLNGPAVLSTTYACPFTNTGLYKVTITATYNDGVSNRVLRHAMFTN